MHLTLREVRTLREMLEGAHHVLTPAIMLAHARAPRIDDGCSVYPIVEDTWVHDLTEAQLRIDGAIAPMQLRQKAVA